MPTVPPIVRIGWKETVIDGDAEATAALTTQFNTQHAILLHHALDDEFLSNISGLMASARFVDKPAPHVGTRRIEEPGFATFYLRQALTRPAMLTWLSRITHCGPLGGVIGNITQYGAQTGHHLGWHHDIAPHRKLAVTINLGTAPYEGGEFEMRQRGGTDLLLRYAHLTHGTMMIFRVTQALEHRVTPVTCGGPRLVFSGWFLDAEASADSASTNP